MFSRTKVTAMQHIHQAGRGSALAHPSLATPLWTYSGQYFGLYLDVEK